MPTPKGSAGLGENGVVNGSTSVNTRSRHRKISVKQRLRIYKPADLKHLDQEELKQREVVDVIETGVEKSEEKEVHLHRILTAASNHVITADKKQQKNYIPTPSASAKWSEFHKFYQGKFVEPTTYIKFSATVEDCVGARYNIDENDKTYLDTVVNADGEVKLTEDEFELLCTAFENAIHERQPFLSMDPSSILTFEEIRPTLNKINVDDSGLRTALAEEVGFEKGQRFVTQFDPANTDEIKPLLDLIETHGAQIYEYWKGRKIEANGGEIFPQLKFERPGEKEEVDPYVCFRRREVRHPRKTRRLDVVNSQKLRLLHRELRRAKELALLVAKRENDQMKLLQTETKILEDRCRIKKLKRSLNISGDDDDLVNHKRKRAALVTLEKLRQMEEEEEAKRAAAAAAAAAAMSDSTATAASLKRVGKNKITKKQLEQLTKSGEKLTKQQIQQLRAQAGSPPVKVKAQLQPSPQPSITSHVYVKLPSSKVPDVILEDVDNLLSNKEKNARKFVQEKMEKRRLEDGHLFFNLTDNPFNPVFDISLPQNMSTAEAPFSSIASSKFEIDRSYYVNHLEDYLKGTTDDISVFNQNGEKVNSSHNKLKKVELYDPFQARNEIHSREYPVKFRRRIGRSKLQYIDRKPNVSTINDTDSALNEFVNFDAIEEESNMSANDIIDVYDSKTDELTRLYDQWKYDSPKNEYGIKFSNEPARLNQISNETQVIRFGTMLGTKSYEQLRKATMKYRREYINKLKQQKITAQKLQQQQQQQQRQQQQQQQQQQQSQPGANDTNGQINRNSTPRQSSKSPKVKDTAVKNESTPSKQTNHITQKNTS
ncbi:Epl1p KNAG_0E03310 [Huiozyma naganishii CBS 8797]|uniref:Enhancer of polycomb-like protein n=1 Tax=Huiozyma naganishii (strain ATCC MYA-139 / BCRC 22969 / CBS 8797 / KCTC 17520 / NBRC 10181 / NCYC 3082 / Yp74L-3) TaxID=1071383 RepID=J7R6W0_HUIN7|nr:hypothetical protein KNAG_0E03310 [Kazachstania naganishii CBS 8797]CCK70590.1 hypothetical protein KNAG_0E03310 [Kazachstania naganishii CBS 8797]